MRTLILASMLGLATLNGCATTGYGYHHHSYGHHHDGGGGLALLTGLVVGAAIAESMHDEPSAPEVVPYAVYVPAPSYGPPPPPMVARREPAPPENAGARGLDPILARNALNAVDLRACGKEEGAPIGYGHAKITFNPDGTTQTIVVDSPAGLSDAAVSCIGAKLGEARVPEFRGPATTAGFTFRIR